MGILFSCPFAEYSDVESGLESIIVKSISFGDDDAKTLVRSIGFKSQDSETTVPKSSGSEKMMIEASVSFKNRKLEKMVSVKAPSLDKENHTPLASNSQQSKLMDNQSSGSDGGLVQIQSLPILDPAHPQHGAALKLQKVYKSFRTRRKLADCAVLVEQSWYVSYLHASEMSFLLLICFYLVLMYLYV
jgi:hypothetical protein